MAELAMRKDVPEELKWDLSLIYKSEEAMNADMEKARALQKAIVATYKGKLTDANNIVHCLEAYEEYSKLETLIGSYTSLAVETDYYDTYNQERAERIDGEFRRMASGLSFVDSEIMEAPEDVLQEALNKAGRMRGYLSDLVRRKPHRLHPEAERALTALSKAFSTPSEIYHMAKLADMKFPSFTVDGKEYPLGYSLFEDNYEYETDTKVRRAAFRAFYDKLAQYENVTAAAYNAYVQNDKARADLRGFKDVFDCLLFGQKVTREMYDRQVDVITEKLAPHMRRYARLLKKIYGLDEMTFADLKLSVDPGYDPRVTIEESKEYIKKGLAILGDDYASMIDEAYRDRWVDFARNQGKATGGFCASPYGRGSFILLSWNERMADVFTLAHELGHAGHFRLCNAAQSLFDTNVSSYFVEAPSTMNELLMAHYLLKTSDDKRFRRWVLASMVGHTYYHNFVTHLREAWYQREVYKIVEAGGSVNAEILSGIFKKNLEVFWGDDVVLPEGAELTWMRQPHYYGGLYSYTYSAGLTVATEAALRIEREGAPAVEDWKKVLAAGSTLDPMGLAKLMKIDISTDAPLLHTIAHIGEMIDEICALTEEIDGIRVD
ncbi:MAG: oligoendopeptidase F [Lachnospiraceae bacterium]|nr:oligoendopeptidase F [Lachnospiraceae bacterium]